MLSATREVARASARLIRAESCSRRVLGAKAVLAGARARARRRGGGWLPVDRRRAASRTGRRSLWAVAQGFHPLWYYQGGEQVRRVARPRLARERARDRGASSVLCRAPDDGVEGARAASRGVGAFVALAGTGLRSRSSAGGAGRRSHAVRRRLADGAGLFAYRLAVGAYTVANPVVLGLARAGRRRRLLRGGREDREDALRRRHPPA